MPQTSHGQGGTCRALAALQLAATGSWPILRAVEVESSGPHSMQAPQKSEAPNGTTYVPLHNYTDRLLASKRLQVLRVEVACRSGSALSAHRLGELGPFSCDSAISHAELVRKLGPSGRIPRFARSWKVIPSADSKPHVDCEMPGDVESQPRRLRELWIHTDRRLPVPSLQGVPGPRPSKRAS